MSLHLVFGKAALAKQSESLTGRAAALEWRKKPTAGPIRNPRGELRAEWQPFRLGRKVARQNELKNRTALGTGGHREAAVVGLDDRSGNRKAHAHAVS